MATALDIRGTAKGRKNRVINAMVELIKEHQLTYDEFIECGKHARDIMELGRPKRKDVIKPIPSLEEVRKFLAHIEGIDAADALKIKLMLFLGIRSVELTKIKKEDLDLTPGAERVFVNRKGGHDKWFVIPSKLSSLLRMYVGQIDKQVYLFEASYHKPYCTRSIREMIQRYRTQAGVSGKVHAHNFRHMLLTLLAAEGWTDSEMQLVSGHKSRTNLDRYIRQNPEMIREKLNGSLDRVMGGIQ